MIMVSNNFGILQLKKYPQNCLFAVLSDFYAPKYDKQTFHKSFLKQPHFCKFMYESLFMMMANRHDYPEIMPDLEVKI